MMEGLGVKNEIISVLKETEQKYVLVRKEPVGYIELRGNQLWFMIEEEFRGNHYASNGVYLLTKYIHDTLKIKEVSAFVSERDEIAKHVLEHSGFHIDHRSEAGTVYVHEKAVVTKDDQLTLADGQNVLYLAGGCFWGVERVFKLLDGVVSTCTGYANGNMEMPSYEDIIRNETGYKECVRVIFDTSQISVETLLKAYFMVVDPSLKNQQGEDIGTQYQSGIYFKNTGIEEELTRAFEWHRMNYMEDFYVEFGPLHCFYEAEEYHQDYLDKNPGGYCHITAIDFEKVRMLNNKK